MLVKTSPEGWVLQHGVRRCGGANRVVCHFSDTRMLAKLRTKLLSGVFNRYMRWRIEELAQPAYAVMLEYPINPEPRWGDGKPPHAELHRSFQRYEGKYQAILGSFERFRSLLMKIAEEGGSPTDPAWNNTYFSALDAIALYGILASHNPSRYLEIGSGHSTKFAKKAIKDLALRTRITSVDPAPRAEIDLVCDELVRKPVEEVPVDFLTALQPGDVLFVDNSHRVFMNSDVTVLFLEVLPRLPAGVMVHVHDIFLPYDYPASWAKRHYSEQYLLAAFLIAECPWLEVLLPNAYVSRQASHIECINRIFHDEVFQSSFNRYRKITQSYLGTSFWLRITDG